MRDRERELQHLVEFLRAINRGHDLSELTQTVLKYALSLVPQAQTGTFLVLNDEEGVFEYQAAIGWDLERLSRIKIPKECILQRQFAALGPAIVRDPQLLNRKFLPSEIASELETFPIAAFMTFPIRVEGEVIAYFNVDSRDDPDAFTQADLDCLEAVWEEITLVVRAARARRGLAESEGLFRLLFQRLGDAVYITALDGTILVANPAAAAQSGYALEELVGMNLVRDLTVGVSEEGVAHGCDLISQGKIVRRKEQKRRRGGTLYWTECTLVPFSYRNRPAVLAVHRDVTAQVLAEEEAARHDAVLTAVAFVAEQFLRDASFDETVPVALARLGEAADVSRVYVFQDHRDDQGRLLTSQRYEWTAPGVEPQIANSQLQDLSYVDDGLSRLDEAFARGDLVASLVREFPEAGRVHLAAQQIQAIVVVPIIVRGKRWGFLGFDECRRERAWSSAEIEALRTAAGAFGAAIERGELEGELRARHGELEGLYAVSVGLGKSLDLSEVFQHVYEEVGQLVLCDAFTLSLVDASRGEVRLAFAVEEGERLPEIVVPFDPQRSLTAWVASAKTPLLIGDYEAEKDRLPVVQQVGKAVRSWLGVPLRFGDEILGVLSVQSFAPYAYDENDLRLLHTVSASVATAIRNARAYTGLAEIEQKLRAVEGASRRMKLAQDKPALYAAVLELMDAGLGYKPCAILEPRESELVVVAGHEEIAWAHGLRVRVDGKGLTAEAARSRESVYAADVSTDERYVRGNPDTRCELAIPICVGERVLGVLDVQTNRVDGISPENRDLLGIAASELAVALAGLEQLARLEELSAKLARLHEASRHLTRCTSEEDVCRAAVRAIVDVLGFEHAILGLGRGDLLVPVAWAGSISGKARMFRKGEGIAGKTWLTGEPAWGNLDRFAEARPVDPRIQAFISVPIGSAGVLQAISPRRDAFTAEDVTLVEILARHVFEELRRVQLERDLREQAIRDPLTGLYNRRFLAEVLSREIERAKRYRHPLTLIMADVDDFKAVNDGYGHVVGDAALRCVADALQTSVRAGDFVFRYGGEEFVVVLPETGNGGGDALRRLQERATAIPVADESDLTVSVSLGHVVWEPSRDGPTTLEDLLRRADEVLYAIKRRRAGRS